MKFEFLNISGSYLHCVPKKILSASYKMKEEKFCEQYGCQKVRIGLECITRLMRFEIIIQECFVEKR